MATWKVYKVTRPRRLELLGTVELPAEQDYQPYAWVEAARRWPELASGRLLLRRTQATIGAAKPK